MKVYFFDGMIIRKLMSYLLYDLIILFYVDFIFCILILFIYIIVSLFNNLNFAFFFH